jgi:hypothetical protein
MPEFLCEPSLGTGAGKKVGIQDLSL